MGLWVLIGLLVGAVLVGVAAFFLPERETVITRDVVAEEIREKVNLVRPWVNELKDLKELQK